MKFKTQFVERKRVPSNVGSHFMPTYKPKFDKSGVMSLVIDGKTDIHAKIQADKDSCDINLIVKRFMNGDSDALNKVKGFYADVRDVPTNFAEMLQRISDCKNLFDSLKPEIKEKFNNSYEQFWSTAGSDEWNRIINPSTSESTVPIVKEPTDVDIKVKEVEE